MKSILDPTFKYVPSSKTNISKTFAKIRKELQAKDQQVCTVSEVREFNIMQYQKFNQG